MEDIQQLTKDITKKTIEGLGETFLDIRAALLFIETWQEAYKEIIQKQEEDYKKLKVDFTTVKSYSIQDILNLYEKCRQGVVLETLLEMENEKDNV